MLNIGEKININLSEKIVENIRRAFVEYLYYYTYYTLLEVFSILDKKNHEYHIELDSIGSILSRSVSTHRVIGTPYIG